MKIGDALAGVTRVFLDTAPVIYYVESNPVYVDRVDVVFDRIESGIVTAVTSSITLVECLVGAIRMGSDTLKEGYDRRITAASNTLFMPIGADVSRRAAELRARLSLPLADSLQAGAALHAGCDALVTNDRDFLRVTELRILILDDLTL